MEIENALYQDFIFEKYNNFHVTKPTFENHSSLCQILITTRQESNFSMVCSMLSQPY